MTPHSHLSVEEEIMPFIDGELEAVEADRVRRHLDECAACAGVAADFRRTSAALTGWDAGVAPQFGARIREFGSASAWWRRMPRRYGVLAAAAVLILAVGITMFQPMWMASNDPALEGFIGASDKVRRDAPAATTASSPVGETGAAKGAVVGGGAGLARQAIADLQAPTGPLLVRTARLMVMTSEFESARERVERIVREAGGFMGQVVVAGSPREQRSFSATIRVPTARFDAALAALRGTGTITSESQDGEDVTQQSVDLDARLSNARASEARLKTILEQRTGRLSDVLDVEREISRVRGEIERMEAERKTLDRRIAYASIEVTLVEERKAAMDLGTQSLSTRFRNAFVDGWNGAIGGVVEASLVLTGLLPTLVIVTLFAMPLLVWGRRRRALSGSKQP